MPQYQVVIDPARLRALGVPLTAVTDAVRRSNVETTGRVLEFGGTEYTIRGRGAITDPRQLEEAVVATTTPPTSVVRVKDVARVTVGPDMRRGVADLDGRGDTVAGIVLMRQGANALDVTAGVRHMVERLAGSLPPGVRIVPCCSSAICPAR